MAAFDPRAKHLIHIEASTDADSWNERKRRFVRKFNDAGRHYKEIFDFEFDSIERRAIVGFSGKTSSRVDFGNQIHIVLVPEFIQEIARELSRHSPMQVAIPEGYPLLRAMQFVIAYGGLRV